MAQPRGPRRQFRVVNKGKGKLDISPVNLHEVVGNTEDEKVGAPGTEFNDIGSYRSNFELDGYIYSGFLFNGTPIIKRVIDNTEEFAQGLTDLETDWTNRLTLTYT